MSPTAGYERLSDQWPAGKSLTATEPETAVSGGRPNVTTLVEYLPAGSGGSGFDDTTIETHFGMNVVDWPPG
jgi:hypothetical protein